MLTRLAPEVCSFIQQSGLIGAFLTSKSNLSSTTNCDKVISVTKINLVTLKARAKQELLFNKPDSDF